MEMSRPTELRRSFISVSLKKRFKGLPLISVNTQNVKLSPSTVFAWKIKSRLNVYHKGSDKLLIYFWW